MPLVQPALGGATGATQTITDNGINFDEWRLYHISSPSSPKSFKADPTASLHSFSAINSFSGTPVPYTKKICCILAFFI